MAVESSCCGSVPHTNALTHFQTGMHLSSVAQLSLAPGPSDPGGGHYQLWLHQCVFEKQTLRLHDRGGSWLSQLTPAAFGGSCCSLNNLLV